MAKRQPLEFNGTAGGYFIVSILSVMLIYIPVIGWAFLLNYVASWFADNALVNGKKITYQATYGETVKFTFLNGLLIFVTCGIYAFWFFPKMYRYMLAHTHYAEVADTQVSPSKRAHQAPVDPTAG
jgi:uncharacterized membrane protein YjgN (DUF898 family)